MEYPSFDWQMWNQMNWKHILSSTPDGASRQAGQRRPATCIDRRVSLTDERR
jgi:hypothetical protein